MAPGRSRFRVMLFPVWYVYPPLMLSVQARSSQHAIPSITDLHTASQLGRVLRHTSSHHLLGFSASLLAFAYLCNFAGAQSRLILLLQNWSSLLQADNSAMTSVMVGAAPFLLGGLVLAGCARLLASSLGQRRTVR